MCQVFFNTEQCNFTNNTNPLSSNWLQKAWHRIRQHFQLSVFDLCLAKRITVLYNSSTDSSVSLGGEYIYLSVTLTQSDLANINIRFGIHLRKMRLLIMMTEAIPYF